MSYLRREYFIFRYLMRLLGRNFRKYFTVAGMTYGMGALGLYPSSKPTYFFCRYLDDLADGDIELPPGQPFEQFINRLIQLIQTPTTPPNATIELVLIDAIKKLERKEDSAIVRAELVDFLNSMQLDYQRRVERTTLSQKEIDGLYHQSFAAVLHLALIGFGISLDQEYVKILGLVQGKVYAIQDIEKDLRQGIINVPQEVIEKAGISPSQLISNPSILTQTKAFEDWRLKELRQAKGYVDRLLGLKNNPKATKLINVLVKPLEEYLNRVLPAHDSGLKRG